MTDKKDFTSIHDLGEFEHATDPEIDAQLTDEFESKTTVTSIEELDDDENGAEAFESSFESPEEEQDDQSFEEFSYDAEADSDFDRDDGDDNDETDNNDMYSEEQPEELSANFTNEPTGEIESNDFSELETDMSNDFGIEPDEPFIDSDPDTDPYATEPENTEQSEFLAEGTEELTANLAESSEEESLGLESEQSTEDFVENAPGELLEETPEEIPAAIPDDSPEEFPPQQLNESFEDQMSVVRTHPETYPETYQESPFHSASLGSLGSEDITSYTEQHMQEVAENISDNVPEIPKISTTYNDFKQEVENLSYAPSPEGTGPLFAVHLRGPLAYYKDHIQSILDEYQISVNLNEQTYSGPLQAGFVQISRLGEYIAIQLTNALCKYGISVETYFLEDIISNDEDIEELETRGVESEFNLPQNLQDHAEFEATNDWPEDDILITTTTGPKGYKVLKRCGVTQKIITLSRQDFKNLQVNLNEFFTDDVHLSGSSTLLDGLIKKMYEELKEDAKDQGANCMVNFKFEQNLDIDLVVLHFSADLLYLRKLHVYHT